MYEISSLPDGASATPYTNLVAGFKAREPNHANPVERVALPSDVQSHISSLGLSATSGLPVS